MSSNFLFAFYSGLVLGFFCGFVFGVFLVWDSSLYRSRPSVKNLYSVLHMTCQTDITITRIKLKAVIL